MANTIAHMYRMSLTLFVPPLHQYSFDSISTIIEIAKKELRSRGSKDMTYGNVRKWNINNGWVNVCVGRSVSQVQFSTPTNSHVWNMLLIIAISITEIRALIRSNSALMMTTKATMILTILLLIISKV